MSQQVKMPVFTAAVVNYACLGALLTGLTTAISAANQSRSQTIGLVVGVYVAQTVVELAGMTIEGARWLLYGTFFSAYEPVAMTMNSARQMSATWNFWSASSHGRYPDLGPLGCDVVLLAWALVGLALGAFIFCRRDLPAPL
jgi:ABC-2 type transport system permease protein